MRAIWAGWVAALPALAFVAACVPLAPHHTESGGDEASAPDCMADAKTGLVPAACTHLIVERAKATSPHDPGYTLYFAEFDDQGWPYAAPGYGDAGRQIDIFMKGLEAELARNRDNGVSVVTYVHGWKHDAVSDDQNVARFRKVLRGLSHIEAEGADKCHRKIVGVYVGWRGSSVSRGVPDVFQSSTFWERKSTAAKVAQGSVRELFARVRALQADPAYAPARGEGTACTEHLLRSMIIGHSFGGLIVYEVLSEALIRDIADFQHQLAVGSEKRAAGLSREGDIVMIINPAVEATRFDALARAAKAARYPAYKAPLFVALTSVDDYATRYAFPVGRTISTLFESYTPGMKDEQREADRSTLGHDASYLTMELQTLEQYNATHACRGPALTPAQACAGYSDSNPSTTDEAAVELASHLKQEDAQFAEFKSRLDAGTGDAGRVYPRQFCGKKEMVLSLMPRCDGEGAAGAVVDANSPVWNIRTAKPLITDHGDIDNPYVFQFVRQLYLESDDATLRSLVKKMEGGGAAPPPAGSPPKKDPSAK